MTQTETNPCLIGKTAVLLKRTAYELALIHDDSLVESHILTKSLSTPVLLDAHEEHTAGLIPLQKTLELHCEGDVQYFYREDLKDPAILAKYQEAKNVVSYGGDGTFLWAAKHILPHQNIISINSSPKTSVGFYSCGSVKDFQEFLRRGGFEETNGPDGVPLLEQIAVLKYELWDIIGRRIEGIALNDLLVSGPHPASSAKFWLTEVGYSRMQSSSGLWLCTPLGSNGAVWAAGGSTQASDDDHLQWVTRELYRSPQARATDRFLEPKKGFVKKNEVIKLTSCMRQGLISPDGDTDSIPFGYNDTLICWIETKARRLFSRKRNLSY